MSPVSVSWSKVAIGFIIHKNDKQMYYLNVLNAYRSMLVLTSSMSVSMETTPTAKRAGTIFLMNQD